MPAAQLTAAELLESGKELEAQCGSGSFALPIATDSTLPVTGHPQCFDIL